METKETYELERLKIENSYKLSVRAIKYLSVILVAMIFRNYISMKFFNYNIKENDWEKAIFGIIEALITSAIFIIGFYNKIKNFFKRKE